MVPTRSARFKPVTIRFVAKKLQGLGDRDLDYMVGVMNDKKRGGSRVNCRCRDIIKNEGVAVLPTVASLRGRFFTVVPAHQRRAGQQVAGRV